MVAALGLHHCTSTAAAARAEAGLARACGRGHPTAAATRAAPPPTAAQGVEGVDTGIWLPIEARLLAGNWAQKTLFLVYFPFFFFFRPFLMW